MQKLIFLNKVYSNILFLPLFLTQFHMFFAISASICCKRVWKKKCKVNQYFQHRKDKAQNDAQCRSRADNLTPLLSRWHWTVMTKSTVTSVYLMHPTTVCEYILQNTITIGELLYFWQILHVTSCYIGQSKS